MTTAEAALSDGLKGTAMDAAPIGVTITDARVDDEPLVYVNRAFERLTGYDREEIIGHNCRFLQGTDTDPTRVAELRAGVDEAEQVVVELRNYRKGGEPFWNEVTLATIHDDAGRVTHFVGFQVDVTRTNT